MVRARRISQAFFLGLFFFLLFRTVYPGPSVNRIDYPVRVFLEADPLVVLAELFSSHALAAGAWIAGIVVVGTLLLGRFFCGWICPMGTLAHAVGSIRPGLRGAARIERNRTKGWQRTKYLVLFVLLAGSVLGLLQIGLLDPLCLAIRSFSVSILPSVAWIVREGLDHFGGADAPAWLRHASDALYGWLEAPLLGPVQAHFPSSWLIGLLFVAILAASRWIPRFWCRGLCPLGALSGLLARFAPFGLEKNAEACTGCNACLLHCQGADSPQGGVAWVKPECHLCMNCVGACREGALRFRFFPGHPEGRTRDVPSLGRRAALAGIAAGAAAVPLMRAGSALGAGRSDPRRIRPPGARDEIEFLARCVKCGECMKVCPTNALHPAWTQASFEGLWSPVLIPRIGYCSWTCVLCGTVCPTGAIRTLTEEEKTGGREGYPLKMGTAFIDTTRCLPYAFGIECIVCEEMCPTSPKAVKLGEIDSRTADGEARRVRAPRVDPVRCNGCGACENACPVRDQAAIRVTSVGEARSRTNRLLLDAGGGPGESERGS